MEISPRLTRWINRQFPEGSAEMVLSELRELPEEVIGGQDPERIQAGLGDEDWPTRLDALLGTDI
jgi:hypothetical protein